MWGILVINGILMDNSFKIIDYIKYLFSFHTIAIDLEGDFRVFAFSQSSFFISSLLHPYYILKISMRNLTCQTRIYVYMYISFVLKMM